MINILIVEDEVPARTSLCLDVAEISGENAVIESACDGIEALELSKSFKPDILITDIRMPHMLGTELAEKILAEFPGCKIIFLSGYSDKNFFKSAIRLGVIDYLEKPVDTDDLKNALKKATDAVNVLKTPDDNTSGELLHNLFKNKQTFGLSVPEPAQYAAALLLPCSEYRSPVTKLLKDAAQGLDLTLFCNKKSTGSIEMLLADTELTISDKLPSFFTRFFLKLDKGEIFKCAVGSTEEKISDIHISYRNAVYASDTAFFRPVNTPVYSGEHSDFEEIELKEEFETLSHDIYNALTEGDINLAKRKADILYTAMSESTQLLSATAKKIYYTLQELITEYRKKFFPSEKNENIALYSKISSFESHTLKELHESLTVLIDSVHSNMPSANGNICDLAIFYLNRNFQNPDISINDIVRYCNANTSQLCSIFKAETGLTVNRYLTEIRIEQAKKLLTDSEHNINDISELCGFNYPKYFCRVFKKHTGMSPTDYRRKRKK